MTRETESSHLTQPSSSSLPLLQPQNPFDHSSDSSTQGLQNEGMNDDRSQIPPSDDFYSCIVFNITQLKNLLLRFTSCCYPYGSAREANAELSKPQHPGSDFNVTWSSHGYQSVPRNEQIHKDIQTLSSTFPPPQTDGGFEAMTKNFKQWFGPQGNNNQLENQTDDTIVGSSYMISRNPFDPVGRPCNPFGPIERPLPRLPSSYDLADLGFV